MSPTRRYEFDIKWSGVALVVAFTGGISFIAACWAKSLGGILSIGPIFLSVMFALLALWVIARRLIFPRVLELTDDAILFSGGFSGKRITHVAFADILRMKNTGMHPGMYLMTTKGNFEILSIRFSSIENYSTVRTFICSKTSLLLSEDMPRTRDLGWVPGPILKWSEPKDYIRYRTYLAVSKPLWLRLAKAIRFFACVFGFFFCSLACFEFFPKYGLIGYWFSRYINSLLFIFYVASLVKRYSPGTGEARHRFWGWLFSTFGTANREF